MSGTIPPIPPPPGRNARNTGSPDRVDTTPITNDTINTMTTTNVGQNVAVIKCKTTKAMWNDLILAHEGPSDTRDTKIASLRLKFNAFKALEGKKVNGTFTRLKCLLNDLGNNGVIIPQAKASSSKALISNHQFQDSDSDVEEDLRSNSEFISDLNAEYHECPSNKTSTPSYPPSNKSFTPSYPSSNKSYNKPKPFTYSSP
ncbi:hypothetical protein Tco_0959718 [Tanacetum coccineum]